MSLKDDYDVGQYFYDDVRNVWVIRLEDDGFSDSWFDCKTLYEAEVLSRLIRIERMLMVKKDE